MRNDPQVIHLVTRGRNGERPAWDAVVERYSPLVWSICHRWQLNRTDAEDVAQVVWLRLLEQLANLRDPAALPGWLATTTGPECYKAQDAMCRLASGKPVLDAENYRTTRAQQPRTTCSQPSATPCSARHSLTCPLTASGCLPCLSLIRRFRTPRSARG